MGICWMSQRTHLHQPRGVGGRREVQEGRGHMYTYG